MYVGIYVYVYVCNVSAYISTQSTLMYAKIRIFKAIHMHACIYMIACLYVQTCNGICILISI